MEKNAWGRKIFIWDYFEKNENVAWTGLLENSLVTFYKAKKKIQIKRDTYF